MKIGDYVKIDWSHLPFDISTATIYKIEKNSDGQVLVVDIEAGTSHYVGLWQLFKDVETKSLQRKEKIERIILDKK